MQALKHYYSCKEYNTYPTLIWDESMSDVAYLPKASQKQVTASKNDSYEGNTISNKYCELRG